MKKLVSRYLDTTIYILNLLCIIVLVIATLQLGHDVRTLEQKLDAMTTKTKAEVVIVETPNVEVEQEIEAIEEVEETEWPKLYTDEDVITLAKVLWGEARGVGELEIDGKCISSDCQKAAVIWTVLNRYDAGYAGSISAVAQAPKQFAYSNSNPVDNEIVDLVLDVLDRWNREKHGETDVGRVLPSEYMWFHGDGTYNYFRDSYKNGSRWAWELEDVYLRD